MGEDVGGRYATIIRSRVNTQNEWIPHAWNFACGVRTLPCGEIFSAESRSYAKNDFLMLEIPFAGYAPSFWGHFPSVRSFRLFSDVQLAY